MPDRARSMSSYLANAGIDASVGQGGSYAQAGGLRWSYFEAREALSRGERLNTPERLNLTSLLLATENGFSRSWVETYFRSAPGSSLSTDDEPGELPATPE